MLLYYFSDRFPSLDHFYLPTTQALESLIYLCSLWRFLRIGVHRAQILRQPATVATIIGSAPGSPDP